MTVTVYGIRHCDTMKKARSWLDAHQVSYAFHDYKAVGIDRATVARWATRVGWQTLLNRAGTTFRKLPESARRDIDESGALLLMCEQPSMIKRPVLEADGRITVGFTPQIYAAIFGR